MAVDIRFNDSKSFVLVHDNINSLKSYACANGHCTSYTVSKVGQKFQDITSFLLFSDNKGGKKLLLGTGGGYVVTFDCLSDDVANTLNVYSGAAIQCLAYDNNLLLGFCADKRGRLFQFDIDGLSNLRSFTGTHAGVTTIRCLRSGTYLLSAANNICLWNYEAGVLVQTLTGHENFISEIIPLDIESNGETFLTSFGGRHINAWRIDKEELEKPENNSDILVYNVTLPIATFTLPSESTHIDAIVKTKFEHKSQVLVSVVTTGGSIHIFDHTFSHKRASKVSRRSQRPVDSDFTIKMMEEGDKKKNKKMPLLASGFDPQALDEGVPLTIVYGSMLRPLFERYIFTGTGDKGIEIIKKGILKGSKRVFEVKGEVPLKKPDISNAVYVGHGEAPATTNMIAKRKAPEPTDIQNNEPTLEEQVTEMIAEEGHGHADSTTFDERVVAGGLDGSLALTLAQALQTSDGERLGVVLNGEDEGRREDRVLLATVRQLPVKAVRMFLGYLVEKITENNPVSGVSALRWLKWLVRVHSSYLSTMPAEELRLKQLIAVARTRSKMLPKFMEVHGRLQILLAKSGYSNGYGSIGLGFQNGIDCEKIIMCEGDPKVDVVDKIAGMPPLMSYQDGESEDESEGLMSDDDLIGSDVLDGSEESSDEGGEEEMDASS